VSDWLASRHAHITPAEAAQKPELERRTSTPLEQIPQELQGVAVGCYECHSRNLERHQDAFDHFGFHINVVVSPNDCATCHTAEVAQYAVSKKAYAHTNLTENPVYHLLVETVTQLQAVEDAELVGKGSSASTQHETCLGCHGTRLEVVGTRTVDSPFGPVTVPEIEGWPSQGVGRINPDGSRGSCTGCHPRHGFSLEVARKPYTCAQCHLDPDVPAWNVYKESKHGNIFFAEGHEYDWEAVPWVVGEDFRAPTCATCHNSLVVDAQGNVIAERTHDFGSRLWVRLFGLVYAHPQPKEGDTTKIVNADGLPLPTTFTNVPAAEYLIPPEEQEARKARMMGVCQACHSSHWTEKHFAKLERTIEETNEMTLAATLLLVRAWEEGLAEGLPTGDNPFDEEIEQLWIKQWLFYANSIRYASAMSGAPDYTTFKNGWWNLNENLQEMKEWLELRRSR
jgi:hypothetical protein